MVQPEMYLDACNLLNYILVGFIYYLFSIVTDEGLVKIKKLAHGLAHAVNKPHVSISSTAFKKKILV